MNHFCLQLKRFMPYIFWSLISIVSALMLIELAPKEGGWPYWDKVQHAVVFLVLTIAGALAFPQRKLWVYLGLVFFGALIEVMQGIFTTTRYPSALDWLADIAGILIAIFILYICKISISTTIRRNATVNLTAHIESSILITLSTLIFIWSRAIIAGTMTRKTIISNLILFFFTRIRNITN
jgi:VanZ family protein